MEKILDISLGLVTGMFIGCIICLRYYMINELRYYIKGNFIDNLREKVYICLFGKHFFINKDIKNICKEPNLYKCIEAVKKYYKETKHIDIECYMHRYAYLKGEGFTLGNMACGIVGGIVSTIIFNDLFNQVNENTDIKGLAIRTIAIIIFCPILIIIVSKRLNRINCQNSKDKIIKDVEIRCLEKKLKIK